MEAAQLEIKKIPFLSQKCRYGYNWPIVSIIIFLLNSQIGIQTLCIKKKHKLI